MNINEIIPGQDYRYMNDIVHVTHVDNGIIYFKYTTGLLSSEFEEEDYQSKYAVDFKPLKYYTLDDLVETDLQPKNGYGWLIGQDGTIYSMRKPYIHGMVAALLFPELALKYGYTPPTTTHSWRDYQRFELKHGSEIPLVRIALGMMMYSTNISKQSSPCTPEQIEGVRRVLINCRGMSLSDTVQTDLMECSVRKALKWLTQETD